MTTHRNGIPLFPSCLSRFNLFFFYFYFQLIGIMFGWRRGSKRALEKTRPIQPMQSTISMTWHIRIDATAQQQPPTAQHFIKLKIQFQFLFSFDLLCSLFDCCCCLFYYLYYNITCSYKQWNRFFVCVFVWFSSPPVPATQLVVYVVHDHDFYTVCNATTDRSVCSFPLRQNVKVMKRQNKKYISGGYELKMFSIRFVHICGTYLRSMRVERCRAERWMMWIKSHTNVEWGGTNTAHFTFSPLN